MSLRIIFAGTPEFAVPSLQALLDSPYEVIAVYTQPDRPAGRGQRLTESPVKNLALQHGVAVFQPQDFKDPAECQRLVELGADVMVVVAYGLILPKKILAATQYGAINLHPSLLPRWRGATPIQSAILAGDKQTGVTVMQLTAAMDAGPILHQTTTPIEPQETSGELHDRLAKIGAADLVTVLHLLANQAWQPIEQDPQQVTYSHKIQKTDAKIDWQQPAVQLAQMVRAYNPWPIAYTYFQGQLLRIWQASAIASHSPLTPGILAAATPNGIDVTTTDGILRLLTVQTPGGRAVSVANFVHAQQRHLIPGVTDFNENSA